MENELSWILSLDLLIYKLPASENLVLYVWKSDEQVKRSQIFWGAELVDMSCIREHTQIWPIRTKLEVHNKLVFYKKMDVCTKLASPQKVISTQSKTQRPLLDLNAVGSFGKTR